LGLHKVFLPTDAKNYIRNNCNKNEDIKWKEALSKITIDLNAAGEVNQDGKGKMVWTILPLVKHATIAHSPRGDSISQMAGSKLSGRILSVRRGSDTKSRASYLSKDKLRTLDDKEEFRSRMEQKLSEIKSTITASRAPSVGPSIQSRAKLLA